MNVLNDHIKDIKAIEDIVLLPTLTEEIILRVLRARYERLSIYTSTGNVLLAVNPYEDVHLYSKKYFDLYNTATIDSIIHLPPHPWKTAGRAYMQMLGYIRSNALNKNVKKNQSVLISGESGSGKTETTKIIIAYLTERSQHTQRKQTEKFDGLEQIQRNVTLSNPVLEAFGNARTLRNDNSSRFGKYIKLFFDPGGILQGAAMETFLLETTRVTHQRSHERNFHIFYMLCSETDTRLRDMLHIEPIQNYLYLSLSGCYDRRDNILDVDLLNTFKESLNILGVEESDIIGIFKTLMAILNIGNIKFTSETNSSGSTVTNIQEKTQQYAILAAELLGVNVIDLKEVITTRKMNVRNESYRVSLTELQSDDNRDILAKTLYYSIFMWILKVLNLKTHTSSIKVDKDLSDEEDNVSYSSKMSNSSFAPSTSTPTISIPSFKNSFTSARDDFDDEFDDSNYSAKNGVFGLLDIFGFECMESGNYLEQLLINYANESLQQQFDDQMIQAEQELYVQQGIEWKFLTFPNSKDCLDLIGDRRSSILTLLDEACIAPSGSDNSFINSVYSTLASHSKIIITSRNRGRQEFGVRHYAGAVVYSTEGMVVKNTNRVFSLGPLLDISQNKFAVGLMTCAPQTSSTEGMIKRRTSKFVEASISNTFKDNVTKLLSTINLTEPHYIKCIKPNNDNIPKHFSAERVTEQLSTGGILQTIKVIRSGFPVRFTHSQFSDRYNSLIQLISSEKHFHNRTHSPTLRHHLNGAMDTNNHTNHHNHHSQNSPSKSLATNGSKRPVYTLMEKILIAIDVLKDAAHHHDSVLQKYAVGTLSENVLQMGIQCGRELVFLQQNAFLTLEKIHEDSMYKYALHIQKIWRRYWQYKYYTSLRKKVKLIQRNWKIVTFLKKMKKIKKRLLVFYILHVRPSIKKRQYAATVISKYMRMFPVRQQYLIILWACNILQRFRYHPNVTYVIHRKKLMVTLFSTVIIPLQIKWKYKFQKYKSLKAQFRERHSKEVSLFSTHVYQARKTGVGGLMEDKNETLINGKALLHSNAHLLWSIFAFYCKNKADVPNATISMTKRNNIGLITPSDIISLCKDWGIIPQLSTMHKVKSIVDRVMTNSIGNATLTAALPSSKTRPTSTSNLVSFNRFIRILGNIAVDNLATDQVEHQHLSVSKVIAAAAAISNSAESNIEDHPLYGKGIKLLLSIMDRSEGRTKFGQKRSTCTIASFVGVAGGSSSHIPVTNVVSNGVIAEVSNQTLRTQSHESIRLRCVQMSPEVRQLMRKNEYTLVSLALRYSTTPPPSSDGLNMDFQEFSMREISGDSKFSPGGTTHHYSPERSPSYNKKDKRKTSVLLTSNGIWKMMNEFGVCPDLCSKQVLHSLWETVNTNATAQGVDVSNGLFFVEFIELLDQIAQNCKSNGGDVRSPEGRVRAMFQVMNMSDGREKLARHDRNATVIPPLIGVDKCEPTKYRKSTSSSMSFSESADKIKS